MMTTLGYLLITLVLFNATVTIHEFGHLVVARRNGIKVQEFSLGMGKAIKTWKTKKGLKITLRVLPTGGSVKPQGMTVEEVQVLNLEKDTSYIYASPWKRLKVTLAGAIFNILITIPVEIILLLYFTHPHTTKEWLAIPGAIFWVTLALLGSFIQIIVLSPFNGFSHVGSFLSMPNNVAESVQHGTGVGIPPIITILILFMVLNLFMAVINAIPIYPLDGFFVATSVADWARKPIMQDNYKPLSMEQMILPIRISMGIVIVIVGYLLFRDILKF